tara:strand:+ start:112 stop:753 length:642 start_codon:yes stop_codon:yes gene_type:complete
MRKHNETIAVEVNSKQAQHLQRLGLRYLLQTAVPRTLKAFWRQAWLNRFAVCLVALAVYSITISVVAIGYKKDLRQPQHSHTEKKVDELVKTNQEMLAKIISISDGNINKDRGNGSTAIHSIFTPRNPTEFIDLCMAQGADLNARNSRGQTPLMKGMHRGAYELIIHVLIHYPDRVDLTIENPMGLTLFDMAIVKSERDYEPLLDEIILLTKQ